MGTTGYFIVPMGTSPTLRSSGICTDASAVKECYETCNDVGPYDLYSCVLADNGEVSDITYMCHVKTPLTVTQHRWSQRLEQLESSIATLERWACCSASDLDELQQIGLPHCFGMAVELMWKTAKDYLEENQYPLDGTSPNSVMRQAYAAGLLTSEEVYSRMWKARNSTCHEYGLKYLDDFLHLLREEYLPALQAFVSKVRQVSE